LTIDIASRGESFEVYAAEIQEKAPADVEKYYRAFEKKWKTLQG
jgi:SWI/SNF-related matrix-associated actin-dependent regulator of chromatin subfamily A member 5